MEARGGTRPIPRPYHDPHCESWWWFHPLRSADARRRRGCGALFHCAQRGDVCRDGGSATSWLEPGIQWAQLGGVDETARIGSAHWSIHLSAGPTVGSTVVDTLRHGGAELPRDSMYASFWSVEQDRATAGLAVSPKPQGTMSSFIKVKPVRVGKLKGRQDGLAHERPSATRQSLEVPRRRCACTSLLNPRLG